MSNPIVSTFQLSENGVWVAFDREAVAMITEHDHSNLVGDVDIVVKPLHDGYEVTVRRRQEAGSEETDDETI
jgi:hypothetical protein